MALDITARAIAASARSDAAAAIARAIPTGRFADLPTRSIDAATTAIITSGHTTVGIGRAIYVADAQATAALASAHPRACKADASGRYFRLMPDESGAIWVDALGAARDGTTDDFAVIAAARDYATAIGAGRVAFSKGGTYRTNSFIACGNNLAWDFHGATIKCSNSVAVLGSLYPTTPVLAYVTGDIAGPTDTLKVSTTAPFTVGQFILVRLGHNPWDNNEPRWAQSCKVVSINAGAGTITIDVSIPQTIPLNYASTYTLADGTTVAVPAVAGTGANRSISALTDGDNVEVNDLTFVGDTASNASVEGVLWFQGGRNLRFNNIRGNLDTQVTGDAGTGLIGLLQFCRNVVVNDAILLGNKNGRNQASLGRMLNFSNCVNVHVSNPVARNLKNVFLFAESFCENIVIDNPSIEFTAATASPAKAFFVAQAAQVAVRDPIIAAPQGLTWDILDTGGADGRCNITGHVRIRGSFPQFMQPNGAMLLDYDGAACAATTVTISGTTLTLASAQTGLHPGVEVLGSGIAAGTRITAETGSGVYTVNTSQTVAAGTSASFREFAIVDFRASRTVSVKIPLDEPTYEHGLEGPFWNVIGYASSDADPANLSVYPLRNRVGISADMASQFVAGSARRLTLDGFSNGTACVTRLTAVGSVAVYRNAGTAAAGAFVGLSVQVATVVAASFSGAALPRGSGATTAFADNWMEVALTAGRVLRGSATYNPPNLTAGSQTTTAITVTGAKTGDFVEVSFTNPLSGLRMTGEVTAADTVTVTFANNTAAAVDLASGTLRVRVRR